MGESRHNPDQLLKEIQADEENRNKGHLKIFKKIVITRGLAINVKNSIIIKACGIIGNILDG